ncbi:MAG: DUF2225 domain-containing protein [bacterium]
MPVNIKEIKRRLKILLKEENLIDDYIRRFGPKIDIKCINQMREENEPTTDKTEENDSGGENPIYNIMVSCPVCDKKDITFYDLRAKSQQITYSIYNVPSYQGAKGYKTVDYNRYDVTICPRCLFASPDKKDFKTVSKYSNKIEESQIPADVIMSLQEKIAERKAKLAGIKNTENYFQIPRNNDAFEASYRLAIARAEVEEMHDIPNSLYKLGAYTLKIAELYKKNGRDNTDILKQALNYFCQGFKKSDIKGEANEYQMIINIVALHIRLGSPEKANQYIQSLEKIKTDMQTAAKDDPSINITNIEKWISKVKRLWEDRNQTELFE